MSRPKTEEQRERKRVYNRSYYLAHQQEQIVYSANYRAAHPEQVKESKRRWEKWWRAENPEAVRVKYERDRQNPEKCRQSSRNHYARNKGKLRAKQKVYERNNRNKINERRKRQYHQDTHYRLKKAVARKISLALCRAKGVKSARTMELVGCSIEFLRGYIEARFKDGMTWRNHGEWHIDHVIPCAEFDLVDPVQQRHCFHYSNLQPLWGPDNIRKACSLPAIHQKELL